MLPRVRRCGYGWQLALFARYSYHGFITDRDGETLELEADHRRHAEVENAIRDLKYGVGLNHMPSGRFAANGAWLAVQVMAHNLARWTARIGLGERTVTTKTLRRRVFALVGRITRSARRLTLHLPRRWPWESQFTRALARLRAIPLPAYREMAVRGKYQRLYTYLPQWSPGHLPGSSLTPLPLSSRRPSVSFGGFGLSSSMPMSLTWSKEFCCLCWRTSFGEIESIIGFELPPSARLHRPWWANQSNGNIRDCIRICAVFRPRSGGPRSVNGHSQALAWSVAGWETADVDMDSETLLLRRRKRPGAVRKLSLDEMWPVHPTAVWPEGLSLSREDIYEHRT